MGNSFLSWNHLITLQLWMTKYIDYIYYYCHEMGRCSRREKGKNVCNRISRGDHPGCRPDLVSTIQMMCDSLDCLCHSA